MPINDQTAMRLSERRAIEQRHDINIKTISNKTITNIADCNARITEKEELIKSGNDDSEH